MNKRTQEIAIYTTELVLSAVATYVVYAVVSNPDGRNMWRMLLSARVERFAQRQAEGWAHVADAAKHSYDAARRVAV